MNVNFDIDLDFASRDDALAGLKHIAAGIDRKGEMEKHNTGVYFQPIPYNPLTQMANIDHKVAEELGYVKVDFLNVSIYEDVKDEEHLVRMMKDPPWEMLDHEPIVKQLFHIGDYFWLVDKLKPKSLDQLAMVLAIMRPSKKHLIHYTWDRIGQEIWEKPTNGGYAFKQSHAYAYAMAIIVQMNLLLESD